MMTIAGWDLGGANIKLALIERSRVRHVVQFPCPVQQGPGKFDAALAGALALVAVPALHAVTMTGELSDVFADRQEGVAYLVAMMRAATAGQRLLIYGGRAGFLDSEAVLALPLDVASANWHASATLAAQAVGDGLLVDIGTTTTDLVPFRAGAPAYVGYSDGERLAEGELVYSGVVRTPVMAVAPTAPFKASLQRIAAERFATMADIYRLTGDLPADADPYATPDLKGKSVAESAARLARMLGRDVFEGSVADWIAVAGHFAACQSAELEDSARTLIERERLAAAAPVVGAGCGRFLARHVAERLGRPYVDFADLIEAAPEAREMAARCAPAAAVAVLASQEPVELAASDTKRLP
jgi:(4-(4-[2-(gamma-L-glutamylamino)ethyl]phenoxymethyl)furan-2-yl)methanamine synthase